MAKQIGFIDFYISEWHANNYPRWINEVGTDYQVGYVWAEQDISPVDGVSTDTWCAGHNVRRCGSIRELCEKSDAIVILAPSNPEKHLPYAKLALPFGKPTYIDKPFADTREDAQEIFAIAKKHGTPFFSTSALRYAAELDGPDCIAMTTLGGGSNLPEYIIHQAEMVVKKLGTGAAAVKAQNIGDAQCVFTLHYPDGRSAGMHFVQGGTPFAAAMTTGGKTAYKTVTSAFFPVLIRDMLRFFDTCKPSFDPAQTLEVNRILVAALQAADAPDTWVTIE